MDGESRIPPPAEVIYPPKPSWGPVFLAAGLACLLVGLYKGWVLIAVGAVVAFLALVGWVKGVRGDVDRLPRHQQQTTAVLPALPLPPADES